MFRRFSDWLALTKTERKVILFLSGTALLGAGVRLYQETFPSNPQFDYSVSDSTFAALSEKTTEESSGVDTTADATVAEDDTASAPVNVNTASKQELMTLPGIGDVTATRIIAYRTDVGPFRSIEDLRKVKGISKKKLEKIAPLVTAE
ncbi:MAG TPA: helix-hairpin-helix domain-containing protein [Bacteroidota bacterium]